MRFPNSVDDLLRELDKRFPEVIADPGDRIEDVMFESGQRSVVTYLKSWRANAHKEPPPPRQRGRGRNVLSQDAEG